MGLHAFDTEPEHCALYRALGTYKLPELIGYAARWNMPVARHRAHLGPAATFRGVDHYVLTYQLGGGQVRRLDHPRFKATAEQGAVSLQGPGSAGTFGSSGPVDYAHFYFASGLIGEIGDGLGRGRDLMLNDVFALRPLDLTTQLTAYLSRAHDGRDPPTAMEMDVRAYLVGIELTRILADRPLAAPPPEGVLAAPKLARVQELIDANMESVLRLSDLASVAGLSPFHFARLFRRTTGQSPAAYLMRRRVERAMELIQTTRLSLVEIAHRCGFSSQSHMTRRLKSAFGVTPGALRACSGRSATEP